MFQMNLQMNWELFNNFFGSFWDAASKLSKHCIVNTYQIVLVYTLNEIDLNLNRFMDNVPAIQPNVENGCICNSLEAGTERYHSIIFETDIVKNSIFLNSFIF